MHIAYVTIMKSKGLKTCFTENQVQPKGTEISFSMKPNVLEQRVRARVRNRFTNPLLPHTTLKKPDGPEFEPSTYKHFTLC